jgi:hypothetical protein
LLSDLSEEYTSSGAADWFTQNAVAYTDGGFAAQAGIVHGAGNKSIMERNVSMPVGGGNKTFTCQVKTAAGSGKSLKIEVFITTNMLTPLFQTTITGGTDWTRVDGPQLIAGNSYVIRWTYEDTDAIGTTQTSLGCRGQVWSGIEPYEHEVLTGTLKAHERLFTIQFSDQSTDTTQSLYLASELTSFGITRAI